MQKSKSFKRLLAVVIAVAMVLTAIPFSVTEEELTKDTIVFISVSIFEKPSPSEMVILGRFSLHSNT